MQYVPLGQIGRFRFNVEDRNGSATEPDVMGTVTIVSRSPLGVEVEQPTPGEAVAIVESTSFAAYTAEVDTGDASLQGSGFFAIGQVIGGSMAGMEVDGETITRWFDDEFRIVSALAESDNPETSIGWFVHIGPDGEPEAEATFIRRLIRGDGTPGFSLDADDVYAVSDSEGLVQFPGMLRGKRYAIRREGGTKERPTTVPDLPSYAIPEMVLDD